MKMKFVADGEDRLLQAQADELRESIRAKYAVEFEQAGNLRRVELYFKMEEEFRQASRNLPRPSPYSLYLGC